MRLFFRVGGSILYNNLAWNLFDHLLRQELIVALGPESQLIRFDETINKYFFKEVKDILELNKM